jgi:tRNA A37 threonylcarbamoyladenosine modification protein TsaB
MIILNIDTSNNDFIFLSLEKAGKIIKQKKVSARRLQAEKLLPAIATLLSASKISLAKISKIKVEHRGSSFTALRIGVLTANALAYALGIEVETMILDKKNLKKLKGFNLVLPKYDRDPEIKIAVSKL